MTNAQIAELANAELADAARQLASATPWHRPIGVNR